MNRDEHKKEVFWYACSIDGVSIHACDSVLACLSHDRQEKYRRYRTENDKKYCCISSLLLGYVLKKHYCLDGSLRWGYGRFGRPYMEEYPDIFFSISHSGEWVIVAVSNCNIGVDIEGAHSDTKRLFNAILSEREKKEIAFSTEREADDFFVRQWTLKEAYSKMLGLGLKKRFVEIEADYSMNHIHLLDCGVFVKSCRIIQNRLKGAYWCTLCVGDSETEIAPIHEVGLKEIMWD